MSLLKFSPGKGNAKLMNLAKAMGGRKVYTFSLMSGHTCPYAKECLSKAVKGEDGKFHILDGLLMLFRCFSASQEVRLPALREQRQYNTDVIRNIAGSVIDMTNLIMASLPKDVGIVRIHIGGDFLNKNYFKAWVAVATLRPDVHFYAYTKSLPFWLSERDKIPANFILTASYGGYKDDMIAKHNFRFVKVVESEAEAKELGLEIDHDDTFAAKIEKRNVNFALLIHGPQKPGTKMAKAKNALKGLGSYSKKKAKVKV